MYNDRETMSIRHTCNEQFNTQYHLNIVSSESQSFSWTVVNFPPIISVRVFKVQNKCSFIASNTNFIAFRHDDGQRFMCKKCSPFSFSLVYRSFDTWIPHTHTRIVVKPTQLSTCFTASEIDHFQWPTWVPKYDDDPCVGRVCIYYVLQHASEGKSRSAKSAQVGRWDSARVSLTFPEPSDGSKTFRNLSRSF